MTRHLLVLVHRYCGLYIALFLIVAGLTGSILVFYHELDGWLKPDHSPEHNRITVQNQPLLDPFELRERALKQIPKARIDVVGLEVKPDEAYSLMLQPRLNPATGENFPLGSDNITLNPYTGKEIERNPKQSEQDGYFPLTRKNILQFVYALHYQLALGEVGAWLFWIATLIWTIDCFVGLYLTLPPRRRQINALLSGGERSRTFWQRWLPSWKIKWPASFFRVNFDLHRAFGLWTWAMLFIFAWSSVMLEIHVFNSLPPVYDSVMKVIFDYPPEETALRDLSKPHPDDPVIDFRAARAIGQHLISEQAKLHDFKLKHETLIFYDEAKGNYIYSVCTDRHVSGVCSVATVKFDATTGKLLWREPVPTGDYSGVTVKTWLFYLHMASIWGLPYKLFVCFMGLVVTMLSVTGVYIWWKKRQASKNKPSKSLTEPRIKIQP